MTLLQLIKSVNTYNKDATVKNAQGELKDGAKVTWDVECYGHTAQETGVVEIDEDGDVFIW